MTFYSEIILSRNQQSEWMADSQEKSGLVSNIEKKITELQDYLTERKKDLNELNFTVISSERDESQVRDLSEDIINTRNTINELKSELFRILNQLYDDNDMGK